MQVHRSDWLSLAKAMIIDPDVHVNDDQLADMDSFAKRISYFAKRNKSFGVVIQVSDREMNGRQIETILTCLQSAADRTDIPNDHSVPFLLTTDISTVWKTLRVTDHNYNAAGGVFDYICLEYIDAPAHAKAAVETFGVVGVQGEMDFFHVPGVNANWQVGHIGFSDHNHWYYILWMIICHSENALSAGLLLKQVIQLIHNNEGRMTCLLVDGGTALNKAIGNENAQNELLEHYSIGKKRCFAHIIRMVRTFA